MLLEHLSKDEYSSEDLSSMGYCLGLILTRVLSETGKSIGMQGWSVDDMPVSTHTESDDKLTLRGRIFWFESDGKCVSYQVDIAKNTSPLLYSYKLKDKHDKQRVYVGKTYEGWIINS